MHAAASCDQSPFLPSFSLLRPPLAGAPSAGPPPGPAGSNGTRPALAMDHSACMKAGKGLLAPHATRSRACNLARPRWSSHLPYIKGPSLDHLRATMNRDIISRIHLDQSLKGSNQNIGVVPLPPAIGFGKAASVWSYNHIPITAIAFGKATSATIPTIGIRAKVTGSIPIDCKDAIIGRGLLRTAFEPPNLDNFRWGDEGGEDDGYFENGGG
ncbi:hypothetical protein F511_06821 [Dorcoceras hygrometricum]|uniref:Uncharacterized protein n=1 Tax=Dorcoceras hygrometricum TaxID=472368 RepID=A0A2Z7CX72_9LAMI|nr:hypothetical protein F511_06821 [Dorcoceras hygrometricum]